MSKDGVFRDDLENEWVSIWIDSNGKEIAKIGFKVEKRFDNLPHLVLSYSIGVNSTEPHIDLNYRVELTTSKCNYGGVRYWFKCPQSLDNRQCHQRVGKLYLPPDGKYFGCRHCHNLTYKCRNIPYKNVYFPL